MMALIGGIGMGVAIWGLLGVLWEISSARPDNDAMVVHCLQMVSGGAVSFVSLLIMAAPK